MFSEKKEKVILLLSPFGLVQLAINAGFNSLHLNIYFLRFGVIVLDDLSEIKYSLHNLFKIGFRFNV